MNDLRAPIGFFFSLLGLILVGMAIFSPGTRAPLTTTNVNLEAGGAILAFGAIMLWLARKSF